jgi:LysR family glycine cleavage system transcriptional activator
VLNGAGRAYLERITPIMDELEARTADLFERPEASTLSVRATPSFLARWLIPRLETLRAATGLELRLAAGMPPTDFSDGRSDVIIHWGAEPVPGVVIEPFLATPRVAVAAPALLNRMGWPGRPDELADFTLLRDEVDDCWAEWLAGAGAVLVDPTGGPAFAHCELALTAAERGQGVALAYEALVTDDVAEGRLVRLFPHRTTDKLIYSVAYPEAARRNRHIQMFRDWILAETGTANALADAS